MVIDTWYGDGLPRAFEGAEFGLVQGVSRNDQWIEIFTRAFDRDGREVAAPDPEWTTLLYKPHGLARAGSSFLLSDSEHVEVLTEIDIQRPVPDEARRRRTGRPFLFLGRRCDDQSRATGLPGSRRRPSLSERKQCSAGDALSRVARGRSGPARSRPRCRPDYSGCPG